MLTIAESLKFIKGSVARKNMGDDLQSLTHYSIVDRHIMGFNGVLSMCHPFPLDIEANPDAKSFLSAINVCGEDEISVHMTPAGRLVFTTKGKRVVVKCLEERIPVPTPEGKRVELQAQLIPALKRVRPFISEDASRPWSRGVLLGGSSAFATNNLVLVEQYVEGLNLPFPLVIPKDAVDELVRIGEEPEYLLMDEQHVSFIYAGNKWLRTQVLENGFPDLYTILGAPGAPTEVPTSFFEAVDNCKPFLDEAERIHFTESGVSTSAEPVDNPETSAAYLDVPGLPMGPVFVYKYLKLIAPVAHKIDFTTHPKPSPFCDESGTLRGVVIGLAERYTV